MRSSLESYRDACNKQALNNKAPGEVAIVPNMMSGKCGFY
jgi:hypothetical protein